jgi:hypothetical protein
VISTVVKVALYAVAVPLLLVSTFAAWLLIFNLSQVVETYGVASTGIALFGAVVVLPALWYVVITGVGRIEWLLGERDA